MKNMFLKKGLRTILAMVLSFQMAFGNVVPVLAEEAKAETAQIAQDVYTPSKPILDSTWEVESENENLTVNADGSITVSTQTGTIGDEAGMNNILYYKLDNSTDYEFTVKVDGEFVNDYQSAYLMITSGKKLENVVGVTYRHHNYLRKTYGANMLMGMQQVGNVSEIYTGVKDIGNSFYLKLKKNNSNITGYFAKEYSTNEADWTKIVDTTKNIDQMSKEGLVDADEIYLALAAGNGGGSKSTNVTFSDVKVNGNEVPLVMDVNGYYSLELSGDEDAYIDLNETMKLSLKGFNQDKSIAFTKFDKVVYTSSNERVAKVDEGGVVTATGVGSAVITAEATIGEVTKVASYTLKAGEVAIADTWQVQSPNGNMSMEAILMNDGTLWYSAKRGNEVVIQQSPAGLVTNLGDFTSNLVFKEVSEEKEINESYQMLTGKSEEYTNHCHERVVTFTLANDDSVEFDIVMRAYDDGTAFRYRVRTKEEKELKISEEITGLRLADETEFYYMNYNSATWNYEGQYEKSVIETMATGYTPSMPCLYKSGKNNVWTLYTEADLHGTYCGSMFEVEEDGLLRVKFAKAQQKDVVTKAPFESPWRLAITGTPEDIVENTLVENLNPAADEETYQFSEWVDPGLSSWSWVANWGNGISDQTKKETHMNWIDLAAEMGWEYYILDEGWQPRADNGRNAYEGYRDWFYEVRDYAKKKGVKLCAWVRVNDIRNAEDRRARFEQWSKDGIVAIKADFFDSEGQETIQLYDDLYKDAAKYRLMVNCHGANKPTGEIRTYPNVFAREAIRGQEAGGITANQYTLIPFIRAAIGPADVTEELRSKDYNKTTMGFQIALTALFEDGIHSMGSAPDVYRSNKVAMEYYKNYPDHWDETEYLNGEIGTYLNMARRHEEDWYVSGISVDNRIMRIPLNFLKENTQYAAMIYQENGRYDIQSVEKLVTSEDTLEIPVLAGGGYAVRLVSKGMVPAEITAPETMEIEEGYETDVEITVKKGGLASKEVVWSSADESIVTVTPKGIIRGIKPGTTTVTVAFAADKNIKKDIEVTVTSVQHVVDGSNWKIYKKNSDIRVNEDNSITITTKTGVLGDNPSTHQNLFGMELPDGEQDFEITAKISGGLKDDYQGGFVVAFDGDNPNENYVAAGRRHHSYLMGEHPPVFGMMAKEEVVTEFYCNDEQADDDVYIKLAKKGSEFSGYYSYDGKNWKSITNKGTATSMVQGSLAKCKNLCVGFYAGSGGGNISTDITFSEFTYNGQEIPVAFAIYELCEQLKEAEKAAAELAAKLETAQKAEEAAKKSKEEAEKKAEEAEKVKAEAEKAKAEAEQKAVAAETAKAEALKSAEVANTAKAEAEKKAEISEKAKTEAEQKAENSEKLRIEAEQKATAAEAAQSEAEKKVAAAEAAKAEAEKKVAEAETAKAEAEKKVAVAETAKAEAEQKAAAAKQAQIEAEQKAAVAEQAKTEAEQAKAEAEQKAETAENQKAESEKMAVKAELAKVEVEQKAEKDAAQAKLETEEAEVAKLEAEQRAETAEQAKTEAEQKKEAAEKALKEAEAREAEQKAKAEENAKKAAEADDTEDEEDIYIVGNLIYCITDPSEFTVSVCGTINPNLTKITIPAAVTLNNRKYKVTKIEPVAFAGNQSLKKVVIGANIEKIGKKAFYKAKKLKTIQITSTVLETVGKDAFNNIHKKATVKIVKSRMNKYKKLIKDVRFGTTKK